MSGRRCCRCAGAWCGPNLMTYWAPLGSWHLRTALPAQPGRLGLMWVPVAQAFTEVGWAYTGHLTLGDPSQGLGRWAGTPPSRVLIVSPSTSSAPWPPAEEYLRGRWKSHGQAPSSGWPGWSLEENRGPWWPLPAGPLLGAGVSQPLSPGAWGLRAQGVPAWCLWAPPPVGGWVGAGPSGCSSSRKGTPQACLCWPGLPAPQSRLRAAAALHPSRAALAGLCAAARPLLGSGGRAVNRLTVPPPQASKSEVGVQFPGQVLCE